MAVTIASFTFDYSRTGNGTVRFYADSEFVDPDGVYHPAQAAGGQDYLKSVAFTASSNLATVPTFTLPATWDEASGARSSVTAYVFDSAGHKVGNPLVSNFRIPTLPATTTWAALLTHNEDVATIRDTDTYTKQQTDYQIAQASIVGNPATTTTPGTLKASATPADAASPVAVITDDRDWKNVKGGVFNPKAYGAVCDGSTDDTAAFQAAVAALISNGGGTLVIPESTAGMLVGGAAVSDYVANITIPCTVRGSGTRSVILVHAATGATTDVIRVTPPTTVTPEYGLVFPEAGSGYIFRDFVIRAASGTPARHGIHVDTSAAGSYFSQSLFDGVFFDDLGGRSIYFNNNAANTDGIFLVTVNRCYPSGGIYAVNFGDSNTIQNCRFWGDGNASGGRAVEIASFISGAGNLRLLNNNITQKGGVSISGGTGHQIRGNFIELYRAGSAGTDGAVLSVKGGAVQVTIEDNLFGSLNGNTLDGVFVGTSSAVNINNNYYNLPATTNTVVLDALAEAPWVGGQGYLVGGGSGTSNSSTSAQNPVFSNNNGRTTRVGSLNATSSGNSEIVAGFTGEAANVAIFEINRNAATSDDTGFAALVGAATQSGTGNAVFSVYGANLAAAGAEKRVGVVAFSTDGATNSGKITFFTTNAGTLAAKMTIGANGSVAFDSGTASATAGAATLNKQSGVITTEALTTAAGATYTLTLTDSLIAATSRVFVSVGNGTNAAGQPCVLTVTPGAGSVVVVIKNVHSADALNGTLKIAFTVF